MRLAIQSRACVIVLALSLARIPSALADEVTVRCDYIENFLSYANGTQQSAFTKPGYIFYKASPGTWLEFATGSNDWANIPCPSPSDCVVTNNSISKRWDYQVDEHWTAHGGAILHERYYGHVNISRIDGSYDYFYRDDTMSITIDGETHVEDNGETYTSQQRTGKCQKVADPLATAAHQF